ncbi:MAG: DNA repair exonuclease [Desulfarculaceae bacterium]
MVKVVCTGDLHIGRRSSRIPHHLSGPGFSAAEAWRRVVDLALEKNADLVVIAGDLVDESNRFFEAYGPLERGLGRLAGAGIATLAVAGNHDHAVLEPLQSSFSSPAFHILGKDSKWERQVIKRGGEKILQVWGWSFPSGHVRENPLAGLDIALDPEIPSLGLVHVDLDQPSSRYAPCSQDDLRKHPLSLWVVAHQHEAKVSDPGQGPVILNTGSPQALDPGETGWHGAWLAELALGTRPRLHRLPTSSVRYDLVTVDLDGVRESGAATTLINQELSRHLEMVEAESRSLELMLCRLLLKGRTALHGQLPQLMGGLKEDLERRPRQATLAVEKLVFETRPLLDLEQLADGAGPVAMLARLIKNLESQDLSRSQEKLVQQVWDQTSRIHQARAYMDLVQDMPPDRDQVRRYLIRQGLLLLDSLAAQKEAL